MIQSVLNIKTQEGRCVFPVLHLLALELSADASQVLLYFSPATVWIKFKSRASAEGFWAEAIEERLLRADFLPQESIESIGVRWHDLDFEGRGDWTDEPE